MKTRSKGALHAFPWATLGRLELSTEFSQKIQEQRSRIPFLKKRPIFSLIAYVEDSAAVSFAEQTWASLLEQSYPDWRVWVVSEKPFSLPTDPRFTQIKAPPQSHAWEQKNLALESITEGWVGVISIGDVLSPSALFQIVLEMERQEAVGYFSHEVELKHSRLGRFFSKGEWSRPTQMHWNAVGRFWVVRKERLSPFRKLSCGLSEQLALLEATGDKVLAGVPYYLYYRRSHSVPAEDGAFRKELAAVLGDSYQITGGPLHQIQPPSPQSALVSAVICFRDKAEMTRLALESLLAVRGTQELEVLLVDNDSKPEEIAKLEPFLSTYPVAVKLVHFPGPFHYGPMHNWVIRHHCQGSLILFLNNDVRLDPDVDLAYWASWAQQPEMATVGIQLRFADGRVQHAGIRAWYGGEDRLVRVGNSHADDELTHRARQVFANTFAACLVRKSVFNEIGLEELERVNGFGDVGFCFRALRQGYKHFYLGSLKGVHQESSSRGRPYEYWEEFGIERDFPDILQKALRQDTGFNRVPGSEGDVVAVVLQALKVKFRKNSGWLDPVKPLLKKWLRNRSFAGNNAG